jgi:hypothetical protein
MLDEPARWSAFQHFTSNRSLDSIVLFFHSLLPPQVPAAPRLRDARPPGPPPAEADRIESPLPDTTLGSSPASPPDLAPMAPQPQPPPPLPPLSPPPRHTTSSTRLTRHASVANRQQPGRPSRQRASKAKGASNHAPNPSSTQNKRPSRQRKAPRATTRASLRLAGRPPEFEGF